MAQDSFSIKDIDGLSVNVELDTSKTDELKNTIKSLSLSNFKVSTVEELNFMNFLNESIPLLNVVGGGYEINVTRKGISLGFLDMTGGEFSIRPSSRKEFKGSKIELFTKDRMNSIDSDFNFILGLIFGKMGISTEKAGTEFRLDVSRVGRFQRDYSHLLNLESKNLFGKVTDLHIDGISFTTEEELFGTKVKTYFRLAERAGSVLDGSPTSLDCYVRLTFTQSLPYNTFKILEESLARLNNVIDKLSGGVIVSK